MRVALADDHERVRSALRLLLENEPDIIIAAEASTARDLISRMESTTPDVVLLDWELPGVRAVHLIPVLRSLSPNLIIIALSGRPEARDLSAAAGVDAFVDKGEAPETLLDMLRDLCPSRRTEKNAGVKDLPADRGSPVKSKR